MDLLPAMMAVSITMDDAGRAPGSTVSGAITLSAPSRQLIRQLLQPHHPQQQHTHNDANTQAADSDSVITEEEEDDADADDDDGRFAEPARRPGEESDALLANGHNGGGSLPSPIAASSLLLAPLTRGFPLDLKLQLTARCIYDRDRLHAPAMQRFATAATAVPNGQGAKQTVFRMWSTRVAEASVSAADCAAGLPRTFAFHARLPSSLPPSFSGSSLKHVYYLQLLGVTGGRKVLDVKLPFRVRVAHGGSGGAGADAGDKSAAHTLLATGRPQVVETPAGLVSSLQLSLTSPLPVFSAVVEPSPSPAAAAAAASSNLLAPSPLQSSIPPLQLRLSVETGDTPGPPHALSSGTVPAAPLSFGLTQRAAAELDSAVTAAASSKHHAQASPPAASGVSESEHLLPRTRRPSFPLSPLLDTPLTFNLSKTVLVRSNAAPASSSSLRDRLTGSSPPPAASASAPSEMSAHVVKLTLDHRYTRPGDTVRGHLDFSAAQIRCYRVNINLEQIETVAEDVTKPAANGAAPGAAVSSSKVYWQWHAYTVNTLSTHFTFCLPLDVLPHFTTDLVEVSWALRFQLITDVDASSSASWSFLPAPSATKAEPLRWVLPLMVLPNEEDACAQPVVKTVLCTPTSVVG